MKQTRRLAVLTGLLRPQRLDRIDATGVTGGL
jgi:hypothetical protein